jgi:hypothetical protein
MKKILLLLLLTSAAQAGDRSFQVFDLGTPNRSTYYQVQGNQIYKTEFSDPVTPRRERTRSMSDAMLSGGDSTEVLRRILAD